ncbi:hypothetical protein VQH23_17970 [Pararoseomonas sp. SCSIO 73927]|uniref:hypothetical protein n=1 Tax=Pararoseomonas sp. SCSIO 73927 TaxID=3114537 RepID=UPI0030CBDBC6
MDSACLGMCPSELFAFRRPQFEPAGYDLCLLEFACNDATLLGGRMLDEGRVRAAIGWAVSELSAAGCLPVLVILPVESLRARGGGPVRAIYRDLAERYALPFLDGYDFLDRLAGPGAPPFRLFRDNMHIEVPVSTVLGRELGPVLRQVLAGARPGPVEEEQGVALGLAELAARALGPVRSVVRSTALIEGTLVLMEGDEIVEMRLEEGWEAISVIADFNLSRGVLRVSGEGSTSIFVSVKENDPRREKPMLAIWPLRRGVGPQGGRLRLEVLRDGPAEMNASSKSSPLGPEEVPRLAIAGFILRRRPGPLPVRRFLPGAVDLCAMIPEEGMEAHRRALAGA